MLASIPREAAADNVAPPVCRVGAYEVHPVCACSEAAIAELFAKICQRGNPLLQGKPKEDLLRLGAAMYRKAAPYVASVVCVLAGEPVALMLGWDCADGGVWKGTDGPPPSLAAHAAVAQACWSSWPQPFSVPVQKNQVWFGAFGGVTMPHSGQLFNLMALLNFSAVVASGFRHSFGYTVHPTLLASQALAEEQGHSMPADEMNKRWPIIYRDIEHPDHSVRAELAAKVPTYTNCSIMDVKSLLDAASADPGVDGKQAEFIQTGLAAGRRLSMWGTPQYAIEEPNILHLPEPPAYAQAAKAASRRLQESAAAKSKL